MSEIPAQWFGNARPLPLDKNRRVDFSLDVKEAAEAQTCPYDTVHGERFMGRLFDQVPMPDGGRIIHLIRWGDNDPDLPPHVVNRNVFRLDHENNVIWQVHREDTRREFKNDPVEDEFESESNLPPDPFIGMSKLFFVRRPLQNKGPFHPKFEEVKFDTYAPGRLLWLTTHYWAYDLDPKTGMAVCTGEPVR